MMYVETPTAHTLHHLITALLNHIKTGELNGGPTVTKEFVHFIAEFARELEKLQVHETELRLVKPEVEVTPKEFFSAQD